MTTNPVVNLSPDSLGSDIINNNTNNINTNNQFEESTDNDDLKEPKPTLPLQDSDKINNNASINSVIKDQNLPFSYKFDNNITVSGASLNSIIEHVINWSEFNESLARYLAFICSLMNDDLTDPKYALINRLKWVNGLCKTCNENLNKKEVIQPIKVSNNVDREMEVETIPDVDINLCALCKDLCGYDVKYIKVPDVNDLTRKKTVTLRSECLMFMCGTKCIIAFGTDTSFDVLLKRFKTLSNSKNSTKQLPIPIIKRGEPKFTDKEFWSVPDKKNEGNGCFYASHIFDIFKAHETFIDAFIQKHMTSEYLNSAKVKNTTATKIGNGAIEVADLNNKIKFIITGWSEGGAVAQLCSLYIAASYGCESNICYTFGQPRLGNEAFAKLFNEYVRLYFRICNSSDEVPHLPAQGHIPLLKKVQIPGFGGPAMHPPHRRVRLAYPPSSLMIRSNAGVMHNIKTKFARMIRSKEINFRVHTYYCGIHLPCKFQHTDQLPFYLYDKKIIDEKEKKNFQKNHGMIFLETINDLKKDVPVVPIRCMVNTSIFHDETAGKEKLKTVSMDLYLQDLCGNEKLVGSRLLKNENRELKENN